ncbi:MAG TPA: phosphoribosylaminoimidazolesuccinocarboxamide synthase [Spirochaetota bacterium]|nr:phosphoribosylaminoimidazolesuccinocarboxamide synthase [Spirochaetota bacterium]HPJ38697.1 phosphoribosylaminoimidazolesuccinocarboxamide synthase [Spirochaetota bacterium]HPQ51668.1 phosphoribosylaminoimidazolesuccinocarboxamide synthase [Spirochaetota bacterium]
MEAIIKTDIPGAKKLFSGKVRDVYEVDAEHLVIVATDRLSAFDHVFPNGIPGKGKLLNQISNLWFSNINFVKNHLVETDIKNFPKPFCDIAELEDRSVMVKKAERIDFECVARGYIIGSGWKDYLNTGEICGIALPEGLQMAQQFPHPIFTPAIKAQSGHDMNVSVEYMRNNMDPQAADKLGELTLRLYEFAREKLSDADIILADTKFEFGFINNEIILIDEVLTPDSSRFWDKTQYKIGDSPVSFDKQFVRDFLETTTWDKNSPPPPLPEEIVSKTKEKYVEIYNRIKDLFYRK